MHTRGADRDVAAEVVEAVRSGPATWPGIHVTTGKEVIELSVVATHKGTAIDALRTQLSASAVIFLGDDVTDENAFGNLHGPDVGIKIGPGETKAAYCVDSPEMAVRVLGLLTECRRRWLFGENAVPIERHTMLANGRTLALLTPAANVTWLCHPKSDSPAVFAAMLGDASAGYFSVAPDRAGRSGEVLPLGQRYRAGSMTVETRWSGLTVTDWLDGFEPDNALVRVLSGSVPVRVNFAPRPEFGQVPIQLQPVGDELHVYGSNEPLILVAPGVEWEIVDDGGHHTAHAVIDLRAAGGTVTLELRLGGNAVRDPVPRRRGRGPRPPGTGGETVAGMGGGSETPDPRAGSGAAQRAHPAGPVLRADRRDPRRRHVVAARGDGRATQLGLPVLLAARRRDERPVAGGSRLRWRG